MPKIEVSTTVTFYVQWILHPFPKPQVAEHRTANSKWALGQTKDLLKVNSIGEEEVKIAIQNNGITLLEILNPDFETKGGKEFWTRVLNILENSNGIESISVLVNNDISEKIASNYADRVPHPWHMGYQGYNTTTRIYHK